MKRLLISALLALASFASTAAQSGVGMNLNGLTSYSPAPPMIDVMKQTGAWLTSNNATVETGEESTLKLDANDYPTWIPAANDTTVKWRFATSVLSSGTLPLGIYILTYDGEGAINYWGAVKDAKLSKPGRDVVNVNTVSVLMRLTATNPTNYVRNMHLWRPGGACGTNYDTFAADASACLGGAPFVPYESFPATAPIWYPPWLADMRGFKSLRFMDWNHTNSTTVTKWADRSHLEDRRWNGNAGVPIEAEMDLANRLQADAWMNVPPYVVDTDYAYQIGKLAAKMLTGTSRLDLEYANETWNYAFAATNWILAQSNAHWSKQVALPGANQWYMARAWYGERLVQLCNAAKAANPSTRCVANTQAGSNGGDFKLVALCAAAVQYDLDQPCYKGIDVVSIAPYFGYYVGNSVASTRSIVDGWTKQPDGGLTALFNEFTTGQIVPGGSLAQVAAWTKLTVAYANTLGIPVWAYEGGQGLTVSGTDAPVQALFAAANRDPRMSAMYDRMLADWTAGGGQLFNYFTSGGIASQYGFWGMKLDQADDASPKWQAAARAKSVPCTWAACVTKPLTVPPIQ